MLIHIISCPTALTCLLVQLIPGIVTLSQPSPSSEKMKEADFHRSGEWVNWDSPLHVLLWTARPCPKSTEALHHKQCDGINI